jgi:hypothetical protein
MIRADRRELSDDTWIRHHPERDFGGRRRALAMSASFWAGILRCSGISPAFTIAGALKGTASLRFAMRGYNEPKFAHGGSTANDARSLIDSDRRARLGACTKGSASLHQVIGCFAVK